MTATEVDLHGLRGMLPWYIEAQYDEHIEQEEAELDAMLLEAESMLNNLGLDGYCEAMD